MLMKKHKQLEQFKNKQRTFYFNFELVTFIYIYILLRRQNLTLSGLTTTTGSSLVFCAAINRLLNLEVF